MVTYKNVRVKMANGKYRMQRAQVLASGKYKFVKNLKSGARKVTKRVRSKSRSIRRSSNRKTRGKTMAKRKMTIPLAVIGGVAGMPSVRKAATSLMAGNIDGTLRHIGNIVGVENGGFNANILKANMVPLITGLLIHKFVGGSPLNANRYLANAGVPLIRI